MSVDRFDSRDLFRVPNLLSLSRLALAAVFPIAHSRGGPLVALGVLAVAGASDLLDGWWARHFHEQSALGATIDAVADKIFVLTVVITLVVTGAMTATEAVLLGTRDMGEIALAGRLYLSRSQRKELTKPQSSNIPGKIATTLQYAAVVAIILGSSLHWFWVGIAAVAGILASVSYWTRERLPPSKRGMTKP